MPLATARRRPTRRSRVEKVRVPVIWSHLPDADRAILAHVLAVLVRRLYQTPGVPHEPA
jgi:hypothetical protein